ncbi:MAG: patatin-like phospholipase family protein, partial [Pseudomonadota bacterium]
WGVLDYLAEDNRLDIKAITATSAGAMNAVAFAAGLHAGGPDGARASLRAFWKSISDHGAPVSAMQNSTPPAPGGALNPLNYFTPFNMAAAISTIASPYDLNPFDYNPLRDAVRQTVDFEAVRAAPVELHLAATNVNSGRVRVFAGDEVTLDAVLASACLPQTFKAVEIDGQSYWDGGYLGNPSLFPLIYSKAPKDIVLVTLNPIARERTPRTAPEIQDRMNEISFNAALVSELRAIAFVQKLLDEDWLADLARRRYRKMHLHVVSGGSALVDETLESKFDTRWSHLTRLRDRGRDLARHWLETNWRDVGKRSTIDLRSEFLGT